MIKLIATDMDGTFVNNKKEFSPEFNDVFYQLKENGILFCAASGRQYASLYNEFQPISDDMLFIAENGGYIAYGNKTLKAHSIKRSSVDNVVSKLGQIGSLMIVVCGVNSAYILNKHKHLEYEVKKYYFSYQFINDYSEINDEIVKVAIYDPEYKITRYLDQIQSFLTDDLKLVTSGFEWMDITRYDVHKGIGISLIQEMFNISKDECAAFGDNMNDYDMMTTVTYSYAMSNAAQPIKDISYEIIGSNEEFGVITKIKEILQEI